jgi:hypothetical protein
MDKTLGDKSGEKIFLSYVYVQRTFKNVDVSNMLH